MKQIFNVPVSISIEPLTRLILVKQGENEATLSKNDVSVINNLFNGVRTDGYISTVTGCKFSATEKGVLITNQDEQTLLLKNRKKGGGNDVLRIKNFMENHRPQIAWDRDFRHK